MADDNGLWSAIGEGFRGMGAVASPAVAQSQARERADVLPNMMRSLQIKGAQRALDADTKFSEAVGGLQPSSFKTSSDVLGALKNVPLDVIAESPRAQATLKMAAQFQAKEAQQEQRQQAIQFKYDQLDMQREMAEQRAQDARASAEERARANLAREQIQTQLVELRKHLGTGQQAAINPATADLHGDDFIDTLQPADRNTIKGLISYDIDPKTIPGGMVLVDGQNRSRREYMISLARQADPTYSEPAYREKQIALSEFQRKKGDATRFLNVSIDHIDTAQEYSMALKNGDVPALNKLKNWWQQNTGQAAPNTFNGIKDIVASEVIKGAIGGPGGVEERRENAEKVKAANSPEQLDQLFMGWKKLMAGQMKGLEKAYESGTRLKNFREKYMLPRARKALEEVSGDDTPANGETEKPKPRRGADLPAKNDKGWALMVDAKGNKAYVGPNNEIEEVR